MTDIFEGIEVSEEVKTALAAKLAEAFVSKDEFNKVKGHADTLLTEAKTAKEKARLAEQERQEALRLKAEKDGDHETLKKVYEEKARLLEDELNGIKTKSKREKISSKAKDFVSDKFVDDPVVREFISGKFASRLDIREDRYIVLDAEGNPTGLDVKDLENEFLNTEAYKRHTVATRATGGGATGGRSSGGAAKVMARSAFDAMDAGAKMDFIKSGGKVT